MSEQTARLVARLRSRLRRTTRRMTWAELAFGTAVAVGAAAAVWFLATVLEASLWLGTAARTAVVAAVGTVALGVAAAVLARPLGQLLGLLPGPSDEEVARTVGRHDPAVADRLVNLLQLAEGKRSHAPAPFVDQAVQDLAADLDWVSFEEIEDFGHARRAARLASLPLAAVLAFLLVAPSTFLGASERLLAPNTEFEPPAPFEVSVAPGSVRLVEGDSLQITVRTAGSAPTEAVLQRRSAPDDAPERIHLQADSAGTFHHTLSGVRESFQYRVVAPPVRSSWYGVEVLNRPLVQELQLTVTPPSYTGRSPRELDPNVGDVSALPGAQVSVSAALGGPSVDSARLAFSDDTTVPLEIQDGTAAGSFPLRQEGTYHLHLESTNGTSNRDPIRYDLSVQTDARPSVTFLQPTGTTDLSDDLAQTLRVQLSDDYGFSQAKLFYRRSDEQGDADEASFSSLRLPLSSPTQTDQTLTYEWLLAQDSGLDPEPGDAISYYVKAWDNDTVNGPKSGRTATQRLRVPTLSEQYEELDETQEEADRQMQQLRQRSDSVRREFQQLRDELRRTREADWQDRRRLERLQKKQQSLDQGVEKLSEKVQEMNRQMQKDGLSSSEMSQKFQELQKVIEDVSSPDLKEALDQLRKAMQNDDLRQMQQAMEEVEEDESSYREQLERTTSLFKQLKAQQKLQEMGQRAGELSERQQELRKKTKERMEESAAAEDSSQATESTSDASETNPSSDSASQRQEDTPPADSADTDRPSGERTDGDAETDRSERAPSDSTSSRRGSSPDTPSRDAPNRPSEETQGSRANQDLAEEQTQTAEDMQKLEEAMEDAEREMQDVQSAPREQLQKLNEQLQRRNLPEQMQQNSQQLQQNQLQDAQQGQQQMQQSLQNMQQQLSKMENQMQGQQRQINLAGLRSALENTLRLSKEQESLRTEVDGLAAEGPTVRSYARDQKSLSDGLKTVTDSLRSIAERVPQMSREVQEKSGNALRAMETATSALDERDAAEAVGQQKTSMMHLNELALLLSNLLEQLQNQQGSGSGSSMQQMMQTLQQMSGQQQKLNKQIQQYLNDVQGERLSSEQAQRRKELAKQQRQIKQKLQDMEVGSEAQDQIMGDLDKIAKQMEQTTRELDQNRRPARDLIERQQKILTRLLNAQNSLRTQGEEEQRRGRSADEDYEQPPPGDLPSSEEADQLRRDLIRALEMGYSSDYEELIKRYFELLQQNEDERP